MGTKCGKCDKEFNSDDALGQHMDSKHGRKQTYTFALIGVVALVVIIVGYFIATAPKSSYTTGGDADANFVLETDAMDNGEMHIHPYLQIVINGENQVIPSNMGISSSKMNIIHMHDASGKIHVESPVARDFKLKHFFLTWSKWSGKEKVFNSTCIFEFCNTADKKVKMFVNDKENTEFGDLILKDLDRIKIEYGQT